MNRLGLALSDLKHLSLDVNPELVMSHLACAETPEHPLNVVQRDRFAAVRQKFPNARASFANSAGLFWVMTFCLTSGVRVLLCTAASAFRTP